MGQQTWTVEGYGIIVPDDEHIIEFIKAHKDTFCQSQEEKDLYEEMLVYTAGEYDLEDFFEKYGCANSGQPGPGAVISNIMSRETGLRFEYHRGMMDYENTERIIFTQGMPWHFNETEKNLTRDALDDIMNRYAAELGIGREADYEEIEYYG